MQSAHIGQQVLSETEIAQGVQQVADRLNQVYGEAVVITVVPGGILFTADLVRKLTFDITMDYISCPHTPGDRHNQSAIVFHQNVALAGQHVIIIDDAIESGGTIKRLVEYIGQHYEVASLAVATLLVKPGRISIPVTEYFAYEMPDDDLLVGYGLPWNDKLRHVPFVSKLVR